MNKKMNRCFNSTKANETVMVGFMKDFPFCEEAE